MSCASSRPLSELNSSASLTVRAAGRIMRLHARVHLPEIHSKSTTSVTEMYQQEHHTCDETRDLAPRSPFPLDTPVGSSRLFGSGIAGPLTRDWAGGYGS